MKYKRVNENGFLVVLDVGDSVVDSLVEFAKHEKIVSAQVQGIGALSEVILGYFDILEKKYLRKSFQDSFELLNCSGNFCYLDGAPIFHLHVMLGTGNFNVIGGHLFSGKVSVTGEFFIDTSESIVTRKKGVPLSLIDLSSESVG